MKNFQNKIDLRKIEIAVEINREALKAIILN